MVKNVIRLSTRPDTTDQVREIYSHHFEALRTAGDKIVGYEILVDDSDPTTLFAIKSFTTGEDFEAHNNSPVLQEFLGELKSLLAGPPEFHSCTLLVAL